MRLAFTLIVFIISIILCGDVFSQTKKIDSLRQELIAAPDSIQGKILYSLFMEFVHTNYDSALTYASNILMRATISGDSMMIVRAYHGMGDMELELGRITDGIDHMEKALGISIRNKFDGRTYYILNNLAIAYTQAGDFDKALEYNFRALRTRELNEDTKGMGVSRNNIGLVYFKMGDYNKALTSFKESRQLALSSKDNYEDEVVLENIGYCYNHLGDFDKATEFFLKALESCKSCDAERMMTVHIGLGEGYLRKGDLKSAEDHLSIALTLSKQIGDLINETSSLRGLSELRLLEGKPEEALGLIQSAMEVASNSDLIFEKLDNYNIGSAIYAALDDPKRSYDFKIKYAETLKEIFTGKKIANFSEINSRFQKQTNLATIENQRKVIALKDEELQLRRFIIGISIVITLVLLVVSALLWRGVRLRNRIRYLLDQKVKSRTEELKISSENLRRVVIGQHERALNLSKRMEASTSALKDIMKKARMEMQDSKVDDYLVKIEQESEKLAEISFKNGA